MCGLYGYITKTPSIKQQKAFELLGVLNEDRGTDSTGMALYTDKVKIYKDILPALEFFEGLNYNKNNINMSMGHNRMAVIGKVNKENAQPMQCGNVIGTHNGIINNYADFGSFVVDSEVIFYLLNKTKNDFQDVCKKINGSVAIAYTYNRILHLSRKDNPLYILVSKNSIYYCSLEVGLRMVVNYLGLKGYTIFECKADFMYIINQNLQIQKSKVQYKETANNIGYYDRWNSNYYDSYDLDTTEEFITTDADYLRSTENCVVCGKKVKQDIYIYNETENEVLHYGCLSKLEKKTGDFWLVDDANPIKTEKIKY